MKIRSLIGVAALALATACTPGVANVSVPEPVPGEVVKHETPEPEVLMPT